jgi:glycosyltransferase involved in cell wall biosynthesis
MNEHKPLLSVVIPHLNQPEALANCLASLQDQTIDQSLFEVIVVDNGSASLPHAVIARYPGTLLLQEAKAGPGHARNRGVKASSGQILAFIDADCRAHPEWLQCALAAFERAAPRTILGGDVQIWHEPHSAMTAVEAYESVFAYRFKLYIEQHGFCGTGNLIVRKQDFEDIGPFRGIEVAEDIQWGGQALKAGYLFRYVPEMVVYHPARESFKELCIKWDRHIQHAVNAGSTSLSWRAAWVLRAFAVFLSPAVDWTKVVRSQRLYGPIPRAKAVAALSAIRFYRTYKMIALLLAGQHVHWNRGTPTVKSDQARDLP